ncbi:hypothetical protein J2TS6_44650 [Paenibacillus albilobatus]|uniref:SLH domain-containing protein n=3 Tax=Paenibacillus TaxID=44249 RepID=A0A920CDX9_9BACL|nr:X2-like carbohydrate binding domain-containing protein [Paenibacillus albilobatus]GIO33324.1 hypothetical protein J2TS6_44650 [Paenibacillus albilobatus]
MTKTFMKSRIAALLCLMLLLSPLTLVQPPQAEAAGAGLMFTSVATERDTTLALDSSGRIWAWGSNLSGQFGNGTTSDSYTPLQINVMDNGVPVSFKEIKVGLNHAIALDRNGRLWGAGQNVLGQLGLGQTTANVINWTKIDVKNGGAPVEFKEIAAARSSSFALDVHGKLWIWGQRTYTADPTVPIQQQLTYPNGDPVVFDALEANDELAIALDSRQRLWTLYQPDYRPSQHTLIDGGQEVKFQSISAGSTYGTGPFLALAIDTDGNVWSWGGNDQGQLGDKALPETWIPTKLSITDNGTPATFVRISGGLKHVLALDEHGDMWTWGLNDSGQLGDGTTVNAAPHKVQALDNGTPVTFVSVYGGYGASYGLDADGRLWSWGKQNLLGDNTSGGGAQMTPKKIPMKPQLSLTSSVTTSTYLEPITFTASVTGNFGVPSGSITFSEGNQPLGSVMLNDQGYAQLKLTSLQPGLHHVTAAYEGDGLYLAEKTNPIGITVTMPDAPSVSILPSTTGPTNDPVIMTVTVETYGNSNALANLKWLPGDNNAAAFANAGTDILIPKSFAAAGNGTYSVYAKDLAGNETVEKINVTNIVPLPDNSAIDPAVASFDKYEGSAANADVTTTLILNGNTLSGIANGAAQLAPGIDYTLSGDTVTISKAYLNAQPTGTSVLTFTFSGGADQTMTIAVSDSTPRNSAINPSAATFDKYAGATANADVKTTLTLNGNTLSGIANGAAPLTSGIDYTLSGDTVTISKAYLNAQPTGTSVLTFTFSGGAAQTMTIHVSDSTPTPSGSHNNSDSRPTTGTVTVPPKFQVALEPTGSVAIFAAPSALVKEKAADGTMTQKLIVPAEILDQAHKLLKDASKGTIIIKANDSEPSVQVQLPGGPLAAITGTNPNAAIGIELNESSLEFQLNALNLDSAAKRLGAAVSDLQITASMAQVSDSVKQKLERLGTKLGFRMLSHAADFKVTASAKGQTVQLNDSVGKAITRGLVYNEGTKNGTVIAVYYDPGSNTVSYVPSRPSLRSSEKNETMIHALHHSTFAVIETDNRSFTDMNAHWAKEDVEQLASRLIVDGVSAGRFAPDESITRAEFAALLVRALGLSNEQDGAYSGFEDVPSFAWYAPAVEAAVKAGLVDGMTTGSFMPDERISREQMAVMLARALSLTPEGNNLPAHNQALAVFKDQDAISPWAQASVSQIVQAGIIGGMGDGNFAPADDATRAQAAAMLKRFLHAVHFIE